MPGDEWEVSSVQNQLSYRFTFNLCDFWLSCRCDKDIKVSYTVYNRLSVLLKSLLAITRVTPAYKLSRKQGHDYVILYRCPDQCWHRSLEFSHIKLRYLSKCCLLCRIYFGEVQLGGLGEGNFSSGLCGICLMCDCPRSINLSVRPSIFCAFVNNYVLLLFMDSSVPLFFFHLSIHLSFFLLSPPIPLSFIN